MAGRNLPNSRVDLTGFWSIRGAVRPSARYLLAMLPRPPLQPQHSTLVHPIRRHNRLGRAAMRQQGDQHHHKVFTCPQPVEDHPCGLDKRPVARAAFVAVFFETVHADVSLANLSPCGTSRIGAKHGLWVHWHSPGLVSEQNQIVPEDPVLSKYIPHHDSVGSPLKTISV